MPCALVLPPLPESESHFTFYASYCPACTGYPCRSCKRPIAIIINRSGDIWNAYDTCRSQVLTARKLLGCSVNGARSKSFAEKAKRLFLATVCLPSPELQACLVQR